MGVRPELAGLSTPIDELTPHPDNPRRGNVDVIAESLRTHGQYRPIVVDQSGTVLAGNHTLHAARQLGWAEIAAVRVDVDDDQARRILLVDNRAADLGSYDDAALIELLQEINAYGDDLTGTGYDLAALDELIGTQPLVDDETEPADDSDEIEPPSRYSFGVFGREVVEQATFEHYRAHGFPLPRVPRHLAMVDLNALAATPTELLISSRRGYAVADTYHPHRFDVKIPGKLTPRQCFADDQRLRIAIGNVIDNGSTLADGTVRGIVSLTRGTQGASNFRPAYALSMYRRFAPSGATVLDSSMGFGGRLVGFLASSCAHYVGIDPSTETCAGNRRLVEELLPPGKSVEIIQLPAEDVSPDELRERCDFAFTSPPYFAKEHYSDEPTQSYLRYPQPDAWRRGFLQPMLALQYAALKPDSINVVNIAGVVEGDKGWDSARIPLAEWAIDDARAVGFEIERVEQLALTRRWGAHQDDEVATEPVIIMRKP